MIGATATGTLLRNGTGTQAIGGTMIAATATGTILREGVPSQDLEHSAISERPISSEAISGGTSS